MPNIKSAKKRVLTINRSNNENALVKSAMKTAIKNFEKAIQNNQKKESLNELLTSAYKRIDKALKINIIKTNTAARYKSRLSKMINNIK